MSVALHNLMIPQAAISPNKPGYPLLSEWPCLPQSVWMVSIAPTEPLAIYHQSKNFAETSSSLHRPF
jgi:hypothetical protein